MIPSRSLLRWIERIALDSYARGYAAGLEVDEQRREAVLSEVLDTIYGAGTMQRSVGAESSPGPPDVSKGRSMPAPHFKDAGGHSGGRAPFSSLGVVNAVARLASPFKDSGGVESRHAKPTTGRVTQEPVPAHAGVASGPLSPSNVVAIHERRPDGKFHL